MSSCGACKRVISITDKLLCSGCTLGFHYGCVGKSRENFSKLSCKAKSAWKCPECKNRNKNRNDNETPVKGLLDDGACSSGETPLNESGGNSVLGAVLDSSTKTSSYDAILGKIEDMLDRKLEHRFSVMLSELKSSLSEDIKLMVQAEVGRAIDSLKVEVTATTDFFGENQKSLEQELQVKCKEIKLLASKSDQLEKEVCALNHQLKTFDRQSRSLNVEIQAVPEKKNENIQQLFKKLCQVIDYSLVDDNINACRRVAKMNPNSKRPRNILVTLTSVKHRDNILSAVHRYNKANKENALSSADIGFPGEKVPIYVNEHLSAESKDLLAKARKLKVDKSYKFAWVKFGRVYMRKDETSPSILIKNHQSFEKL